MKEHNQGAKVIKLEKNLFKKKMDFSILYENQWKTLILLFKSLKNQCFLFPPLHCGRGSFVLKLESATRFVMF